MEQEFTATSAEMGEMEFNIFGVYLSDMTEERPDHHYLGFQRTLPDPDAEPDDEDSEPEHDGFYVEYNGQECSCYQRAQEAVKVSLIEMSDTTLQVSFAPAAKFHMGTVDDSGDMLLSKLIIHLRRGTVQVSALREALQTVVGQDCPFRYSGSA